MNVPGDGHCFISCIRLFFREYLPDVPDQTITIIRDKFDRLDLSELFQTKGLSRKQYESQSRNFFERAEFDSEFVDIFVGQCNHLFNIKVIVFKVLNANQLLVVNHHMAYGDERNHYPDHSILVLLQNEHYRLLVPANRHISSTITPFNNGVGGVIRDINDQGISDVVEAAAKTATSLERPTNLRRRTKQPLTEKERIRKKKTLNSNYHDNQSSVKRIERDRGERLTATARKRREKKGKQLFGIEFTYDDIDETDELYAEHYLGPMNVVCTSCDALHWEAEKTGRSTNFTMCCEKGKVYVPPFKQPPADLLRLFTDENDPMYDEFHKNIIKYNNSYSTASAVAEIVFLRGNGPPVYKVHGQIVHSVSSLSPNPNQAPSFGQYFILDMEIALNERLNNPVNYDCKREVGILF